MFYKYHITVFVGTCIIHKRIANNLQALSKKVKEQEYILEIFDKYIKPELNERMK